MMTANRVHRLLNTLHNSAWDSFFNGSGLASPAGLQPRVWTADEGVTVEIDLPGRNPEDIEVTSEKNRLIIETKRPLYDQEGALQFRLRERSDGPDRLEFRAPFVIQAELTDIVYQHGVLRIQLKKPAEEQPRKLQVRHG